MRRARALGMLFGNLALAAAASACSNGVDHSEFSENVCRASSFAPLEGITPAVPVEYMELRHAQQVVAKRGVPCDPNTACGAELAATTSTVGWTTPTYGNTAPGPNYLVYTRGEKVGTATSLADLKAFLAPIENTRDAALLVTETLGHSVLCRDNNARPVAGGFELATTSGIACGSGSHRDEHIVFVSTNGDISIRETWVVERGSGGCAIGRRPEGLAAGARSPALDPIGAHFAEAARLEAASIHAFDRLARELSRFGAPRRLVRASRRARGDEVRHAKTTRTLAARHGGRPAAARVAKLRERSLFEVLAENATEGCVRETFGALLATYQAANATDPEIARVMKEIALDETRHAALAWDVAAWAEPKLAPEQRRALAQLRARTARELEIALGSSEAIAAIGLPNAAVARALFRGLFRDPASAAVLTAPEK